MNIRLIIILISCFDVAIQQRRLLEKKIKPNVNFFYKINYKIHVIMNKLLLSLKLNKNFTKSNNSYKLTKMHFYFNNILKRNYRIYEEIKNINKINGKSHKKNLDGLLQEIVKEEIDILKNYFVKLANRNYESQLFKNDMKTNDSEETKETFMEMWSKFNDDRIELIIGSIINENIGSSISTISNNTIGQNDSSSFENSHEYLKKTLLQLSDRTIEHIVDPIINENKSLETTKPLLIVDENSNYLNIWKTQYNETRRIYKGRKTKIKNYPFVASIHMMNEFLCAGSIISMDMVLTAASCLQIAYNNKHYRNSPRNIFVRLGSDHIKRSGKLIPIIQIIFHPKYDSVTLKNNLAIAKMFKKIKHSKTRRIKKIQYEKNTAILPQSVKEITILGWGARDTKDNSKKLQRLTKSHLDIYNIKDCKEVYSKYYITETNFCAGFTSKGGGACKGDVGGPAVVAEELVGVVSFGPKVCGMADAPTVFTKVGYYSQWIDEVLNKKSSKKKINIKTTTQNTSNILIIPLYTTAAYTKHYVSYTNPAISDIKYTVSERVISTAYQTKSIHKPKKITERALTDDPEEIQVLKKLFTEFILGNHTVIDYLTNAEINYDEKTSVIENLSEDNQKVFLNHKRYRHDRIRDNLSAHSNKVIKPANITNTIKLGKDIKSYNNKSKYTNQNNKELLRTLSRITKVTKTTLFQSDYDGRPTKLATFVESSEFPEDVFSSDLDLKSLFSNDSSSYYEIEIPIDENSFKSLSREKILDPYSKPIGKIKENPKTIRENRNVTGLLTTRIGKENSPINNNGPANLPDSVDDNKKDLEIGLFNIYHKSESESVDDDKQVRSNKKEYLSMSDSSDTVIHFITGETSSDLRSKATSIVPDPKGMAMTISLEDFSYEYDQRQIDLNQRDFEKKYDYK